MSGKEHFRARLDYVLILQKRILVLAERSGASESKLGCYEFQLFWSILAVRHGFLVY